MTEKLQEERDIACSAFREAFLYHGSNLITTYDWNMIKKPITQTFSQREGNFGKQ